MNDYNYRGGKTMDECVENLRKKMNLKNRGDE